MGVCKTDSGISCENDAPMIMTSDRDIYRAAKLLIDQHGLKGASDYASDRIAALRDKGDH